MIKDNLSSRINYDKGQLKKRAIFFFFFFCRMRIAFLAVIYLGSLLFLSYTGSDPAVIGYARRVATKAPPPPRPTNDDPKAWQAYCSHRDEHQRPIADFECVSLLYFFYFIFYGKKYNVSHVSLKQK